MVRYTITRKAKYSKEVLDAFESIGENAENHRVLIFPNQSHNFWDKYSDAQDFLIKMLDNNDHEKLVSLFGPITELEITACECWDNGDCKRIINVQN